MKYRYFSRILLAVAPSLWRRLYLGRRRPYYKAPWVIAYNMLKYYVS